MFMKLQDCNFWDMQVSPKMSQNHYWFKLSSDYNHLKFKSHPLWFEQNLREANNIVLTFRCCFMWDGWEEEEYWIWNLFRIQTIFKLRLSKKWRWIKENGKWFPVTLVQNYLTNTVKILAFIAVKAINQMSSSLKGSCFIHLINTWHMGQDWTAGFDPHSCAKFFTKNS